MPNQTKGVLFLLMLIINFSAFSQNWVDKVTGIFEHEISEPKDSTHYHSKYVIAPIISYEPSTSLGIGVGAKLLFKFPKSFEETRTSNVPISAQYTLKNQFIFTSDFTIFSNQEQWLFKGNISALKYPAPFFGIGSQTVQGDEIELSYRNFLFEPLVLKRIHKKFFLGGGLRYNNVYESEVEDETNEFQSLTAKDVNQKAVGVELAATYDSRSNVLNSTSGWFIEYTLGSYDKDLGSTDNFKLSKLDARTYFDMPKRKYDVLAFQLFSRFSWGDVPLLEYSTLGGEDLLRGTPEGRFRDFNSWFFQTEYRWQTWERIGMVFFGGMGDVFDNPDELQMENLKFSVGSGVRLKIVKAENLNIRFDYGLKFGREFNSGFYLNLAEAF